MKSPEYPGPRTQANVMTEVSLAVSMGVRQQARAFTFWGPLLFATYMALTPLAHVVAPSLGDKHMHFLAFGYLSLAFWWAFPRWGTSYVAVVVLIAYGVLIEIIQGFIPNRVTSLGDLIADGLGILCGLGAVHLYTWLRARRSSEMQS